MLVVCTPFEFHVLCELGYWTTVTEIVVYWWCVGGGGTSGSHSGPNFCLNSVAGVIIVLRITSATQGKLLQL